MGWSAFFAAIAGPLARRVLLSVGIGMVTLSGLGVVQSVVSGAIGAAWSGMSADAYQIVSMAGFVDAVSYWLAAVAAAVAWASLARLGPLPGGAGAPGP